MALTCNCKPAFELVQSGFQARQGAFAPVLRAEWNLIQRNRNACSIGGVKSWEAHVAPIPIGKDSRACRDPVDPGFAVEVPNCDAEASQATTFDGTTYD